MDNRQHADNTSQSSSGAPQRRLYVYDRPFADIQPRRVQRQQAAPASQGVHQPARSNSAPQPSLDQTQHLTTQPDAPVRPSPAPHSLDGFIPTRPQEAQLQPAPSSAKPFQLQEPVRQPVQPVPPGPSAEPVWQMEMPNELQEHQQPINTPRPRVQQQTANTDWRPLQQASAPPQPREQTPQTRTVAMPDPILNMEQQFAGNARTRRVSPFTRLRMLLPSGMKIMVALILIVGVFVAVNMIKANQSVSRSSGNFNQPESDDLGIFNTPPNEAQSTGTLGVSQTADAPKTVKIDAIDLAARVVTVGTSRNSIVKAPSNIYDLGWYEGSAKPGQKGAVLMHGHTSGPTRPGALYEVALLKRGDVISVERGDGKIYNYTVQSVEFFENDTIDMSKMLTPYNPNKNGLNIMTAGGRFNTETNAYELRAAVYAVEDTN